MKVSYVINTVFLLVVSVTIAVIFREVDGYCKILQKFVNQFTDVKC